MACRLFGTKPLFQQMLAYCQLNPKNIHMYFDDISFDKITDILFKMKKKLLNLMHLKMSSAK